MSRVPEMTIVSGGQTGADRAALDFAIDHGLPHDGWCPRGRRAEDGPLDGRYRLRETTSPKYDQRTKWNVRDSDATVVFSVARQTQGGTALTLELAERMGRPTLHLAREDFATDDGIARAAAKLREFLVLQQIGRLNVAGLRASQEPEIAAFVREVLEAASAAVTTRGSTGEHQESNLVGCWILFVRPILSSCLLFPNPMALQVTPQKTRIGWIGTGVMGGPMCGHLIDAGYQATVTTRTKSKADDRCSSTAPLGRFAARSGRPGGRHLFDRRLSGRRP